MEQLMDVSWMTHGKEKLSRYGSRWGGSASSSRQPSPSPPDQTLEPKASVPTWAVSNTSKSTAPQIELRPSSSQATTTTGNRARTTSSLPPGEKSIPITIQNASVKPMSTKSALVDERKQSGSNPNGGSSTTIGRRGSWFAKISAPFSSSAPLPPATTIPLDISSHNHSHSQIDSDQPDYATPLPKISPNKNAVLPHAAKQLGEGPYVPAPPKSGQPGILGVFRRLSSTSPQPMGKVHHGLVDRCVLNVDKNRERSRLRELNQSKLRRVAFCVDVEIAPTPKYADECSLPDKSKSGPTQKKHNNKIADKEEGNALKGQNKNQKIITAGLQKNEAMGSIDVTIDQSSLGIANKLSLDEEGGKDEDDAAVTAAAATTTKTTKTAAGCTSIEEPKSPEKETSRKKEKKKKSEAERKAKREQKRKEQLEKGAIPMEIHLETDSSTDDATTLREIEPDTKPQVLPTTNPGRIYRRCCQLRETDILTKVTTQLPKSTEGCPDGKVDKLDLTGYFMSLPDLVTLGDFLAVVPVNEVILDNCGLTDEGARVILAGLLAAKQPQAKHRRPATKLADLTHQGGLIKRLTLKNNQLGLDGWKHLCLFIHLCRSIRYLDVSGIPFPRALDLTKPASSHYHHYHLLPHTHNSHLGTQLDISMLLSKALGERLAGSDLELLNLGGIRLSTTQLGAVMDGIIKSGVCRLGLANNSLDRQGIEHVARYLRAGKCYGLDLGGNDLGDHLGTIADAINETTIPFWALSLADCKLSPGSLCKLFSKPGKLKSLKFMDLSHNRALFESEPSASGLLRRYLPRFDSLRRLHLRDVAMSSEQAIALAEILSEVKDLAHVNLLENSQLVDLVVNAKTDESQEEACALFASLLTAARVSKTLVKIDIENPGPDSGEVVKALANQMLAYCLRNLRMTSDLQQDGNDPSRKSTSAAGALPYPEVLRHILGFEEDAPPSTTAPEPAPDNDYVIGGTGVVKALACCLKNRGEQQPDEFLKELGASASSTAACVSSGKAKDMSKHLLCSARKIRVRLQPVLAQAKALQKENEFNYHRINFLDQTLEGIIKRFEDEFPETRQPRTDLSALLTQASSSTSSLPPASRSARDNSFSSHDAEPVFSSDNDDEINNTVLRSPKQSRSNSLLSYTSKAQVEEEGRNLRLGHKFRRSILGPHDTELLQSPEAIKENPEYVKLLLGAVEDLATEDSWIRELSAEKGPMAVLREHREELLQRFHDLDPEYFDRFIESQEKAKANVVVAAGENGRDAAAEGGRTTVGEGSAVVD